MLMMLMVRSIGFSQAGTIFPLFVSPTRLNAVEIRPARLTGLQLCVCSWLVRRIVRDYFSRWRTILTMKCLVFRFLLGRLFCTP
jgi:hypothetical protein